MECIMKNSNLEDVKKSLSTIKKEVKSIVNQTSYTLEEISDVFKKNMSQHIDNGFFDKELQSLTQKNIDFYDNNFKFESQDTPVIKSVFELIDNNDMKQDFKNLLLVRETEIILDGPTVQQENKKHSKPKIK